MLPLVNALVYRAVFAHSVIDQLQPGTIFVDEGTNPTYCLIVSGGGKYLAVGSADNDEFIRDLTGYLQNENNHLDYYDLYVSSSDLLEQIQTRLAGQIVRLYRSSFTFNERKFTQLNAGRDQLPERYRMRRMDAALFEKYRIEHDPTYASLWQSAEAFMEKGFGYCALLDDEFASVCSSFYVGGGYVELDVLTIANHRLKGLATRACAAFIEHCLERDLVPHWDCDAGNHQSIGLATKLGFEKKEDYPILWWHQNRDVIAGYLKKFNY